MSGDQGRAAADEARVLRRVRDDVRQLCRTSDSLMLPQYRHLLGRVEALIEIACHEHSGRPDAQGGASPDGGRASGEEGS